MKQKLQSYILWGSLVIIAVFFTIDGQCQTEEKPKTITNYSITLRYFAFGKIQKKMVLVSSSNSFSTTQIVSDKYLTFSGSISLLPNLGKDSDFLLKYEIYFRARQTSVEGIQNISGMRGLKSKTGISSDKTNACRGMLKLKDKQAITVYTLSNPVGRGSKKKVEPELEFEVSISYFDSKRKKK